MQLHEGGKIMHLKTVFSLPCCWHLQFLFTVLLGIAFESITITCIKKMKQTWCFLHRHISLMNSSICWSVGLWSICAAVASSFRQQQGTAEALPSTLLAKPQVCIRGLSRCILFDFAVPSYLWWLIYKIIRFSQTRSTWKDCCSCTGQWITLLPWPPWNACFYHISGIPTMVVLPSFQALIDFGISWYHHPKPSNYFLYDDSKTSHPATIVSNHPCYPWKSHSSCIHLLL